MPEDFITNILSESMTSDHVTIIKKLSEPKRDEELASELNVKETVVRTLLNDLHVKSLVEYERTKNKKTGWYTYLWKKRGDKLNEYVQQYLQNKLSSFENELESEKDAATFKCSCSRVSLHVAMETDFVCPECNELYAEFDNSERISELEDEIAKLQEIVNSI